MKSSFEIRKEFVDFFCRHGHSYVRGTPLFIADDPTLLFTNAGMNQFKPIFLGKTAPGVPRAVNYQRCMRVSGKHNDLEEVGFSPHHHTLFEMLGNWSFGDYYKKEAITWAWELLTDVWNLDRSKLWVTVFRDEHDEIEADIEAADFWNSLTDVNPDHVRFFGRKDNFWEMGETGPCGPCTEIHMDRGIDFCDKQDVPGHVCSVNGDCRRIVEIWNLVFIQYNRRDAHHLEQLPARHVDTGMGLERVTAVLQNAASNYDTDLFKPIIANVQALSGQSDSQRDAQIFAYRVIADHIRASSFLLADGILPSNEWRGYVLRRIIRRAVRFGTKIGFSEPFLYKAASQFIKQMSPVFPELEDAGAHVTSILKSEENRFFKTLEQGLPLVNETVKDILSHGGTVIPGPDVFKFYDTYGFPVDILREIAEESGLTIDQPGFERAMENQRARARNAWKTADRDTGNDHDIWHSIQSDLGILEFTGYHSLKETSRIEALVVNGHRVSMADRIGEAVEIVINPNPFYAESGGQVGDRGRLDSDTARLHVDSTWYPIKGLPVLRCRLTHGAIRVGDTVSASVHSPERSATARNHTATHLLQSALREVLGDHVKQSGSLVDPDRLRFDFTHYAGLTRDEINRVERLVNEYILSNHPVQTSSMSLDDALSGGITALFGERYEETVRVVKVDKVSAELCGGTHVTSTGEIGLLKILSESSVSAGVRRIEAVTGLNTYERMQHWESTIHSIAESLKTPVDTIHDRIEKMQRELRMLHRELEKLQAAGARSAIADKLANPEMIDRIPAVIHFIPGLSAAQLRELADQVKDKLGSGIAVLATVSEGKVLLIASVTQDLIPGIHAGKILGKVAKIVGGGGGGRPDMAQAGGSLPDKIDDALRAVPDIVRNLG